MQNEERQITFNDIPEVLSEIQNGEIPVNQKGKKYTFFRDDLIKWLESGCKIEAPISTMEINQILSKRPKRRTL